mmetsp:Transcript_85749/g.135425  ORF Transcript_85749/g.135425 Transcript_85749/m.135425 type:complete len:310 (-) Transcript_85749:17-946(-)
MPNRTDRKRLQDLKRSRHAAAHSRWQERRHRLATVAKGSSPIVVGLSPTGDADEGDTCVSRFQSSVASSQFREIIPSDSQCIIEDSADVCKIDSADVETDEEVEINAACMLFSEEEEDDDNPGESGDSIECLICMEELGENRPLLDITAWDLENHANISPLCRVTEHICGECLEYYVNTHERDPEREGSFPCPLCHVDLRSPIEENKVRKACAKICSSSTKLMADYAAFLDYLKAIPNRSFAKVQLFNLGKLAKSGKDSLDAAPESVTSESWYVDACRTQKHNYECYRKAKRQYRDVFPPSPAIVLPQA